MAVKPGSERSRNGQAYIWTGRSWVVKPKLRAKLIALQNRIKAMNTTQEKAARGGGIVDPERSWKSMSQISGTVSSAGGGKKEDKPKPKLSGPATGTYTKSYAKPKTESAKSEKPGTTKPTSGAKPTANQGSRISSQDSNKPKAKKATPSVSQSRTMWVKKGTMVDGKEVKKGYLAQYGKPEKRVTASVKLVEGTRRGKAGETVDYQKGRYKKKSEK